MTGNERAASSGPGGAAQIVRSNGQATPSADPAEMRRWVELAYPAGLAGQLRVSAKMLNGGRWENGRAFNRDQLHHLIDYAQQLDPQTEGVFLRTTTVRPGVTGRGTASDSVELVGLHSDLDFEGPGHKHDPAKHGGLVLPPDAESARKIVEAAHLPAPTVWVHSGGGLYAWWLLDRPVSGDLAGVGTLSEQLQAVLEASARSLGYHYGRGNGDLARVLRLPGTVNRKAGAAAPCHILTSDGPRYQLADLGAAVLALAPAPSPPPGRRPPAPSPNGAAPADRVQAFYTQPSHDGVLPFDAFEVIDWAEILEPAGWTFVRTDQQGGREWRRPGKDTEGISATTGRDPARDRMWCFSDAAGLPANESMTKGFVYAKLYHGGDLSAAAAALRAQGFGSPPAHVTAAAANPLPYFDKASLRVETLARAILADHPAALTAERRIALYRAGVYHTDPAALAGAVAAKLGDRFRPGHRAAVEEFLVGTLYNAGQLLPIHSELPLLNCRNGMLELATGRLLPHDPSYLSSVQVPVSWDPGAAYPVYEAWLAAQVGDQAADLEEVFSTMLDPSSTPPKAALLFGPPRSGKSTMLRLAEALAGPENVSDVSLAQLCENRFAAANVYGKMLNSSADLSSRHVEDLSIFKMMTGQDRIHADRKFGQQFAFTNRALFAFSANEVPTVGESSRAYSERIKPFKFDHSFAGREDGRVETAMRAELPGILTRWVRAWQRRQQRGAYLPTVAAVRDEFETRSDRVRQFVAEACAKLPHAAAGQQVPAQWVTTRRELARAFNTWALVVGAMPMGERKVFDRLTSIDGLVEVRANDGTSRGKRGYNVQVKPQQLWGELE